MAPLKPDRVPEDGEVWELGGLRFVYWGRNPGSVLHFRVGEAAFLQVTGWQFWRWYQTGYIRPAKEV